MMPDDRRPTQSIEAAGWTLRDMLFASLAAVLLVAMGAAQVAALAALAQMSPFSEAGGRLMVMLAMLLEGLIVIPVWVWGPGRYGGGWERLGYRSFSLKALADVALAFVLVLAINAAWSYLSTVWDLAGQPDILPFFGQGIGGLALALILGAGLVPVAEETFFRGFVYTGLRHRWGARVGALVSSLLFSLVHLTPSVVLPIFLMSLLLTWVYERSNSLWPGIILHAGINGLAFLVAYIAPSIV